MTSSRSDRRPDHATGAAAARDGDARDDRDARDVARWRAQTPGCAGVLHLNHAGASLPPAVVTDAVIDHLRLEERIGGYEAEDAARERLAAVYRSAARLIGADPAEIALVENATRAWHLAFYAVPFRPGDRIVTGVAEYASNYLAFLHLRATRGVEIDVAPDDATGTLDVAALEELVGERTRLIAVTHVPTNGGLVNPAERIGEVAGRHGVLYLLDACQSVGQLDVDVRRVGCDFLSVTGRKFLRGPRGTGFLYARAGTTAALHPPVIDLRAATWVGRDSYELSPDARRFETWEGHVAGRLGLGVALDLAVEIGPARIERLVTRVADRLRDRLAAVPGVTVRDKGERRSGIVTFEHARLDATTIRDRLRARAVNVSVTTASSTRLDFEQRGLSDLVRASVHYLTTDDEVDRFAATLADLGR
ncbi:MAG TPA: aminotransferase class V-fold PLP-dependent enzyme [Kineosporiaceae bacterium]